MTPSFNPLYAVEKIMETFGGRLPEFEFSLLAFIQYVEWFAIGLSTLMFLVYLVLQFKTEQVEEEEGHERTEAELAVSGAAVHGPKNPRWHAVLELVTSPHEGDWRRAVLEADSLLRDMLSERGFMGDDIGEQLRGARPGQFSNIDLAWEAHRMRNRIAHEGEGVMLQGRDVTATIDLYRRVFEEFDYI